MSKKYFLYYELEVFCIAMVILSFGMIHVCGMVLSFLHAILFGILSLVILRLQNEFITINENGISCKRSQTEIWSYGWDSIVTLKKSFRFRMPSVEVIAYCDSGESEHDSLPGHYFQLGKAARKALKQYWREVN